MDRRLFLRDAALLAAGAVAVDQVELLRLLGPEEFLARATWRRRLFPSAQVDRRWFRIEFETLRGRERVDYFDWPPGLVRNSAEFAPRDAVRAVRLEEFDGSREIDEPVFGGASYLWVTR